MIEENLKETMDGRISNENICPVRTCTEINVCIDNNTFSIYRDLLIVCILRVRKKPSL